jgi:hypothetical protein
MADNLDTHLLDPLQGFDVKVQVISQGTGNTDGTTRLVGAFTSLMFKMVSQTETYLPLNQRIPRMLDGEIIFVWSLEQGLVDLNIIQNTFGAGVATALKSNRTSLIPRQVRFRIVFESNLANADSTHIATAGNDTQFNQKASNVTGVQYALNWCRVDTCTFGVAAGRHVVANTWQGTAQTLAQIGGGTATA